jgi:hypothetical protein
VATPSRFDSELRHHQKTAILSKLRQFFKKSCLFLLNSLSRIFPLFLPFSRIFPAKFRPVTCKPFFARCNEPKVTVEREIFKAVSFVRATRTGGAAFFIFTRRTAYSHRTPARAGGQCGNRKGFDRWQGSSSPSILRALYAVKGMHPHARQDCAFPSNIISPEPLPAPGAFSAEQSRRMARGWAWGQPPESGRVATPSRSLLSSCVALGVSSFTPGGQRSDACQGYTSFTPCERSRGIPFHKSISPATVTAAPVHIFPAGGELVKG